MHVHFIQANQAQDELVAPGGDALNIDEVEDVALANREAFSSTTRKLRQMSTESVLTVAPLVTLSGTTTVQVKKSDDRVTQIQVIPRLVPVQPGFGGGSYGGGFGGGRSGGGGASGRW
jgi:hypothetical protein